MKNILRVDVTKKKEKKEPIRWTDWFTYIRAGQTHPVLIMGPTFLCYVFLSPIETSIAFFFFLSYLY